MKELRLRLLSWGIENLQLQEFAKLRGKKTLGLCTSLNKCFSFIETVLTSYWPSSVQQFFWMKKKIPLQGSRSNFDFCSLLKEWFHFFYPSNSKKSLKANNRYIHVICWKQFQNMKWCDHIIWEEQEIEVVLLQTGKKITLSFLKRAASNTPSFTGINGNMIEKMIAISQKKRKMLGNLEVAQCALFLYTYVVHFAPPSFTSLSLTLSNISMMVQRGTVCGGVS